MYVYSEQPGIYVLTVWQESRKAPNEQQKPLQLLSV